MNPCLAFVVACSVSVVAGLAQAPVTTTATALPGALAGWTAHSIHQGDVGIWYAHVAKVVPDYGQHEVIAADDKGRLLLLSVYSGNWTANFCIPDGQWLAPTRPADVDPRVSGEELYAGGRGGSIHQIVRRSQPFARFTLESREIGHVGGEEFHSVWAADLLPGEPGDELLAFAISGAVYRLLPTGDGAAFRMPCVGRVPGRVRDVVAIAGAAGAPPRLLGVSRSGDLLAMQLTPDGLLATVLLHEDSGLGRIAASPVAPGVVYVTRDDGLLLRVQLGADGQATRTPLLVTAQGLRGVAAGRFFADGREAVACYGYGKVVQLVSRQPDGRFQVEDLLTTAQQGHWLAVGELDGRNGTDELVATGFDGTVVLLAREPGYGLPGVVVSPTGTGVAPAVKPLGERPPRIAARFGPRAVDELSPLRYQGGFETKALVYETLLTQGADGRLAPGLASAWRIEAGGRVVVLTLRAGATFHDGSKVTADAVATHCRRWLGLPEHDWLGSNRHVVAVQAVGDDTVRFELDRPWALLPDLCAINPTAVRGPGALNRDGDFVKAIGSGPFAALGADDGGRVLRYRATATGGSVELVRVDGEPLAALLAGDVDAVVSSWMVPVASRAVAALRGDPRFQVATAPGSSVVLLELRTDRGVLASLPHRQALAKAIDRRRLIEAIDGLADPATGYAAPVFADWPAGEVSAPPAGVTFAEPLRLHPGTAGPELLGALQAQLLAAGIRVTVVAGRGGDGEDWDLRFAATHGGPYDPFLTAVERFRAPGVDSELAALVAAMQADPEPANLPGHYRKLQARLDAVVPLIPLFAPQRVAVVRQGLPLPRLAPQLYALDAAWLQALAR